VKSVSSTRLRLILIVSAFFSIGAYAASKWLVQDQSTAGRAMVVPGSKAQVGGPFTLTDHTGKRVSNEDFRGKHILIFFGYTFCPDICQIGLQTIGASLDLLGDRANQVVPIFITLDPERDNVSAMADYLTNFDGRLIGLTGSVDEIAGVAKAFHAYSVKTGDSDAGDDYLLDHTSIYYLLDENGDYAAHFAYGRSAEQIAAEIARRL
jgi:protein SCO1/2